VAALLGLGAAAWKMVPRDRFIGWTPAGHAATLPLAVVLPWVRVSRLASHLLGACGPDRSTPYPDGPRRFPPGPIRTPCPPRA